MADINITNSELNFDGDMVAGDKHVHLPPEPPREFTAPFQAPSDLQSFVGRKKHLEQLAGLGAIGVVPPRFLIHGVPGLGKTTLATRIAWQLRNVFDGGVLWVNIEGDELFSKLDEWAFLYTGDKKALSELDGLDARAERLRQVFQSYAPRKKILAVLDSVIDDNDEAKLQTLLRALSDHSILITSRVRQLVAFPDAIKVDLEQLDEDETWDLFVKVLGAQDARLQNARAQALEIANVVEFLPMALDLAARQLQDNPAWRLDHLLHLLRDELRQLDILHFGGEESRRAIRAAILVSYKRLSADEQTFFDALGAFAGTDFEEQAAAAVCATAIETTSKRLSKLKRLSLLQPSSTSEQYQQQMLQGGRSPDRYKLHSLLRTFAREQLRAAKLTSEMQLRMATHYCDIAVENGKKLHGKEMEHALAILDAEVSNIFAGQKWARENETQAARELTRDFVVRGKNGAMTSYFMLRANWAEWIEWSESGLAACENLNDEKAAGAIAGNLGLVYADKGEWDRAIEFYQQSLAIKERVGDGHGMAQTYTNLGLVYADKGEWDRAIEFYQQSLAIKERVGDGHGMAQTYTNLGLVYADKGEWDRAIEFYQ
ncbi:MAG: tetratricopeptide repeat protein, partial [Chloroflexota bacterium]